MVATFVQEYSIHLPAEASLFQSIRKYGWENFHGKIIKHQSVFLSDMMAKR